MIGVTMSDDERGHEDPERGADHDRDRQVDEVASEDESLNSFIMVLPSF